MSKVNAGASPSLSTVLISPAMTDAQRDAPPEDLLSALVGMRLLPVGATAPGERLTGGVSSDIWRIDLPAGPICVKRALAKLRVAADWQAPVERNRYEARWMRHANAAAPGAAPRLLGLDEATGALAMQFLPPERYPLWKTQLRDGDADPAFAAQVAERLVRIHAATAADPPIAASSRPTGSSTTSAWSPTWWRPPARIPTSRRARRAGRRHTGQPSVRWCMAMSARRTSCAAPTARCSSTPNAPGGAIRRSTWPSASITCC